jgi:pimeloyl-ACP methyl ester carboxylesterase
VVEVFGDLDRAETVVVIVPGMSNDLANYATFRRRAQSMLANLRREAAGRPVAVVAWLGYDTPDGSPAGLLEAAGSTTARRAAARLINDVHALQNSHPHARVTVVGHSYGSVVLGEAMRRGLVVPTAVVVGSPGMDVDDRAGLGAPGTNLWAGRVRARVGPAWSAPLLAVSPLLGLFALARGSAPADPVSWAPAHGEDPASRGFGARRFSVAGARSHGSYFDDGTLSARNVARIALGRPPLSAA